MNKFIQFSILLLITGFFISCDMERFPYDNIAREQSYQSIKDAKTWDNGIYTYFRGRQYGIYTYSQDVQVDLLNATIDFGNRNGALHVWTRFLADDYTIRDTWAAYYSALTNINYIIDAVPTLEATLTDEKEKEQLNIYLGNAHFARAFYYNEMALRWSKAYNPTTASTDLSVPIVTKFDITFKPSRGTLKEVYDLILSDIDKAKSLLGGLPGEQSAKRFNKDVVTALEARVKLYMQDWAGAYTAANSLISSGKYPLVETLAALKDMWVNDKSTEIIFEAFVQKPSELANANGIYLGYNATTKKYTPDFVPSKWVVDMYEDSDLRKEVYFNKSFTLVFQGKDYKNIYVVNKFPGNPNLFTTATTNYQHSPKVFRIAEMYLIAAEAAYKQGGANEDNARKALNALRNARGIAGVDVTGTALFQEIKNERLRELAFEGFRLFDLKRWGEGFQRKEPQNIEFLTVTPASDYHEKSVAANAEKFVWGLPTNDITVNENLKDQQNPGW